MTPRKRPLRNFPNRKDVAEAQKLALKVSKDLYAMMEAK
jgi:hypothetical protein